MIKSIGVKVVSSRVKFHGKTNSWSKVTFVTHTFRCERGRTLDAVAVGFCNSQKAFW